MTNKLITLDDGDPHYGDVAAPVTKIVETPPVKRGVGLVRDSQPGRDTFCGNGSAHQHNPKTNDYELVEQHHFSFTEEEKDRMRQQAFELISSNQRISPK